MARHSSEFTKAGKNITKTGQNIQKVGSSLTKTQQYRLLEWELQQLRQRQILNQE